MPDYKEDLEKAVKLVMEAGLSTGHADSFPELMEEVLDQVKNLREDIESLVMRGAYSDD